MKNEKVITVTKPYMPQQEKYNQYIEQIWKNQWLTNKGPLFFEFQTELCKYLNHNLICLTTNGHSALDIAIKGLGLKGEVITTPFTFASTTHALVQNNIKPVFCDIKESDMTIDENKIEELITENTTAILPVHVYGHACNIKAIEKIAKRHHLKVIYDAAHTFGVMKNGKALVAEGDASILSFHATKLFHTIEGGCIAYKDSNYTRIFNAYRNFGIEDEEKIAFVGGNAKMNEFQAAMGLVNLEDIEEIIAERKNLTLYYRNQLDSIEGISYFEPEKLNDYTYNYAYFPVLIDSLKFGCSRDELYNELKIKNIYTRKYFYPLVTQFDCYKEEFSNVSLPIAEKISKRILCLPLYNGLSVKDIDYICDCIKNIRKGELQ